MAFSKNFAPNLKISAYFGEILDFVISIKIIKIITINIIDMSLPKDLKGCNFADGHRN